MDVLVMVEEGGEMSLLAHVDSVASPHTGDRVSREVVTLYGEPDLESLALALAAVVEGHRGTAYPVGALRHLGIFPERGAIGDAAWRDDESGELMKHDVVIPLDTLTGTAAQLLSEFGHAIGRLVAGLLTPDWPAGARRSMNFQLTPATGYGPLADPPESLLDNFREAQALAFEIEGE